ncbi:MAG: DUF1800 family protein [Pirellulaceae bacterium]|nr:DUF1800 family protein [Pirellulaceae bacterium]
MTPQSAWAPYEPDPQRPWDLRRAAHLLRRAGFGADWPDLQQAVADGPSKTIDRLLGPPEDLAAFDADFDQYVSASATGGSTESLRAWWLRRMIETPYPLLEKMTLFWHGHFAVSNVGVNNATLMARSMQTLRRGALGSYRSLLGAVMNDPALYLCLRSERSRRSQPAPNVARQLLAAFGVGPGNFDEQDVTEAARALTGRFVLRNELRFFGHEYDDAEKTLLGQRGKWDADDAVRIVADHPATAEQVVRKLYAWLVSESDDPEPQLLAPLVADLREHDDIGRVVETMLRSNRFFAPEAYRRRIKGPVELAVGLARAMEQTVPTVRLGQQLAELGQDLYRPPTSAGFPSGRDWINQATLIARWNLVSEMLAASGSFEGRLNPAALATKHQRNQPEQAAQWLAELLLDGDLPETVGRRWQQQPPTAAEMPNTLRRLAIELTQLPEYQLA